METSHGGNAALAVAALLRCANRSHQKRCNAIFVLVSHRIASLNKRRDVAPPRRGRRISWRATGTGKTLVVTNFLAGGVAAGEKALLLGYEESKGQLFRNATGWGVDFERMEAEGKLKIICLYPEAQSLPDHLLTIQALVDEFGPSAGANDKEVSAPRSGRQV